MTNLGVMYENGTGGLTRDDSQAASWYRRAAAGGEPVGMTNLGMMYKEGRGGLPKDHSQANAWFSKAAELGDKRAKAELVRAEAQS